MQFKIHVKRFLASTNRFPTELITAATPETISGIKLTRNVNLLVFCGLVSTISYSLYDSFANKRESLDRTSLIFCIFDLILSIGPFEDPLIIEATMQK